MSAEFPIRHLQRSSLDNPTANHYPGLVSTPNINYLLGVVASTQPTQMLFLAWVINRT